MRIYSGMVQVHSGQRLSHLRKSHGRTLGVWLVDSKASTPYFSRADSKTCLDAMGKEGWGLGKGPGRVERSRQTQ